MDGANGTAPVLGIDPLNPAAGALPNPAGAAVSGEQGLPNQLTDMMSLQVFMQSRGLVDGIQFLQSNKTGRKFGQFLNLDTMEEETVFCSTNYDPSLPTQVGRGKYDALWFCNPAVTVAFKLDANGIVA